VTNLFVARDEAVGGLGGGVAGIWMRRQTELASVLMCMKRK
jgi:hypothetical protein